LKAKEEKKSGGSMAGRFKKYPTPPKGKPGLIRPFPSSPPILKTQQEQLLETNNNEEEYEEEHHQQQQQYEKYWRPASLRTLVWVNFILVLFIILFLIIYVLIHKTGQTSVESKLGGTKEVEPTPEGPKTQIIFNLVPHEESNQRWMIVPLQITKPKNMYVCCTKDNVFFCNVNVELSLSKNEVRVSISHPDKVGASCMLNWI